MVKLILVCSPKTLHRVVAVALPPKVGDLGTCKGVKGC